MAGPNRGMPAKHQYTQADLRPFRRDPRCDPQFPLANYWPVYLGNFWCDVYPQHAVKIQEYFGSKGLLVRMVFGRNAVCDPYFAEQRRCKCYDFLVYFVSQQDAHDAVYYCNREMYYGHRLNVLPGRTPAPFDVSRSVKHTLFHPNRMAMSEEVFERHINQISGAQITCVVKHSKEVLLVQYASVDDRNKALRTFQLGVPGLIPVCQSKQRFLEQNVEMELRTWIQANPTFLDMLPPDNVLQALYNGLLPEIQENWKTQNANVAHITPTHKLACDKRGRKFFQRQICYPAAKLFGVNCDFEPHVSDEVKVARQIRRLEKKMSKRGLKRLLNNEWKFQ